MEELDCGRQYEGLSASDLKLVVMDAYFAGYYSRAEAEDILQEYGLASS